MSVTKCFEKLCSLSGAVPHSPLSEYPKDIDIYVPNEHINEAKRIGSEFGFVFIRDSKEQLVFVKFENHKLFMFDVFSSFSMFYTLLPQFSISDTGEHILANDPKLARDLKSFVFKPERGLNSPEQLLSFVNDYCFYKASEIKGSNLNVIRNKIMKGYFVKKSKFRISKYLELFNTGKSISFLGPDGSGKTFIIDLISQTTVCKKQYMGDWFFFLQKIYCIILKIPSPFNRFIYALYYFENILRSFKVYFLKTVGYTVLIDRFPGTNRASMLKGMLSRINDLIFKFTPKPDLFVCLVARPDVVYARKQELSIEEIGKIQSSIKDIIKNENHIIFDTESLDESLNDLLAIIHERKNEKQD
ncbi:MULTISPECIES: hypothetical protein [Vibrio]|uniref:hypothetical protein n=1 Tax=Vibrio TaxID=662 RepID=UPI0022AF7C3F|nr:hypothetical protein [Vibrio atlanticus]MCZ4310105.1 hypothetical protein [Vibrio atlanticus]